MPPKAVSLHLLCDVLPVSVISVEGKIQIRTALEPSGLLCKCHNCQLQKVSSEQGSVIVLLGGLWLSRSDAMAAELCNGMSMWRHRIDIYIHQVAAA